MFNIIKHRDFMLADDLPTWMQAGPRAIHSAIPTIPCSMKTRARADVSLIQASRWEGREPDPTGCDNRAGFFRTAQPKLQGRMPTHAQARGPSRLKLPFV
jgi:hypothetical protein